MSKLKYQPYRAREGRATLCLLLALAAALCGLFLTLATQKKTALPYAQTQLKAAERMAEAERALYDYVRQNDIPIEKDDLNDTGLIGPEWTELTTSLGLLEAKRTALQPDFAALLVKYYQEAGLQPGDTVCIGMSGSFPGLGIASIAAANEMGLNVRVIASYGASMYGATRLELNVCRMLRILRENGVIDYELLAVSPGGNNDYGESALWPDSRDTIAALAKQGGLYIEVGGGIRTEERIERYLSLGVGRCILGSVAVTDFDFTARMLKKYGDKIAVGVDAKDGYVAIHGWKEVSAEPGVAFCQRLAEAGCKAVIYTDIACDGAMQGTNLALYRQLAREVPGVAITASGGISSEQELLELEEMGTAAAILGKSLYTGALDLRRCVALVQK